MFNGFNALMIHLTGTNQELIAEFKAGRYLSQLPASCRDRASIQGILHVLETGEAGSIRGAVIWYRLKRAVYALYRKTARFLGKAALVILVSAVILGMSGGGGGGGGYEARAAAARRREFERRELADRITGAAYNGAYNGVRSRK